ncbi:hypothetical protein B0H16DRAFT_1588799 [Mycena metata]|uniref:Uncharacterized protein n=1 Tax=Mycena metata TaxID=1033252 RepID=A0AAD7HW51_9AGAR|nr:hypothetical protein B0H16DRAFT_1588791 [Mycena metata]KAJ7728487.1 hypothetical protein B0H16DRAFT_1588799 [Mycena metata]
MLLVVTKVPVATVAVEVVATAVTVLLLSPTEVGIWVAVTNEEDAVGRKTRQVVNTATSAGPCRTLKLGCLQKEKAGRGSRWGTR